jgi:hypothetical protein
MTSESEEMVVLRDGAGELYALPRRVLEQYRVPEHQKAEIEQAASPEVSGFMDISPISGLNPLGPISGGGTTNPGPSGPSQPGGPGSTGPSNPKEPGTIFRPA